MNRKFKTKKKSTLENKEVEPTSHKKMPRVKEKYKNWLEEEEIPEDFQPYSFSLDLKKHNINSGLDF
jgi:hypothetical protein